MNRLSQKEDLYKNFRRNMLGGYVDSRYYLRNDDEDDESAAHKAFDLGFLTALAKVRYHINTLDNDRNVISPDAESLLEKINDILNERIEIAYGRMRNPFRGKDLELMMNENENRISDDF